MVKIISVIVPVYNAEKYINNCLESIVNQSYSYLEIIVVDDGSKDQSLKLCEAWGKKDNRIKVIHKENNGVSSARNTALEVASGEYLGFVDSDDMIDKNMFKILIDDILKYSADISVCSYIHFNNLSELNVKDNLMKLKTVTYSKQEAEYELFISDKLQGFLGNKLYRRDLFNNIKIPENIDICEDLYTVFQLFRKSSMITYNPFKGYYYYNNPESATNDINKLFTTNGELKYCLVHGYLLNILGKNEEKMIHALKCSETKTIFDTVILLILRNDNNYENRIFYLIKKLRERKKEYFKFGHVDIKDKIKYLILIYNRDVYIKWLNLRKKKIV